MKQQEIKFFWPLTEQIPLDLDFSQCSAHEYYIRAKGIAGVHGPYPTGMTYVTAADTTALSIVSTNLVLDVDKTTVKVNNIPWYRRVLYKLLGIKWELK
jgi:hypothetical protein